MLLVALTGGIGSGKTLAAEYFADLGAKVLDFDQLARDVVERGTEGFDEVLLRFGDEVLREGNLDRARLAEIVFNDGIARKDLEAITHPKIRAAFDDIVESLPADAILVSQIPLLAESSHPYPFNFVIAVSAREEIRRARLIERGMKDYQISERLKVQASDAGREAIADFIIVNESSKDDLLRQVENIYDNRLYPVRSGL
ncbi:MAG: dephospho-CoA kinase [Actinomycetota bacterium]